MNKLLVCPHCHIPCIHVFLLWDYESYYQQQVTVQTSEEGIHYSSGEPTTSATIHRTLKEVRIQCPQKGCGRTFKPGPEWDIDILDAGGGRSRVVIREAVSKMQEVL